MKHTALVAVALTSVLAACGSTDDGGDAGSPADAVQADGGPAPSADDPCGLSSGFPGDELCILPPASGEGIQIHTGPSSYDDPDALEPFLLREGEDVACYNASIPESGFYYLRQQNRMRTGSHHMLIGLAEDTGQAEGRVPRGSGCNVFGPLGMIEASQTPIKDFPDRLGPEDAGIARYLPAGTMAIFQMHYINTGDPVVREAWVNLYREEEADVTQHLQTVFLLGDLAAAHAPLATTTTRLEYAPPLTEPTRVFQLWGHSHAHSESFTAWRVSGDQRTVVYQSFDWEEPTDMTYNSVVENPAPDPNGIEDGGISGTLSLAPGDRLEWECVVNNTSEQVLHFANEVHTAEMCLLAGTYVSPTSGLLAGVCSTPAPGEMGTCRGAGSALTGP